MSKRGKILSISGLVVAVAITAAYFYYPPVDELQTQGAIGVVQKHQEQQISPDDVILGDEQARKADAALYGDLLKDAVKLESDSAELASFARNLGSADFDAQALARFTQTLDSRAEAAAAESLGILADLQARADLQSYSADLAAMQRAMENRNALGAREFADLEQTIANMARSLDARSNLQARADLQARSDLQARADLQARSDLQARNTLEAVSRQLASREASLASSEMADQLGSVLAHLEARQNLENSVIDEMMLSAKVQQLEARFLEQRVLAAASRAALAARAQNLESRAALANFAADLAQRAASLEHRALAHLQARHAMQSREAQMLEGMSQLASSAMENLQARANLQSREQNLQSVTRALENLDNDLQSRQALMAQRFMFGLRSELAAISQHLEGREQLQSRAVANLGVRNLESRQLSAQNLASFQLHLGNVAKSLAVRSMANAENDALGLQAEQLQSRMAVLQSRSQQ
ncbi:MAG: hypothetical protein ABR517_02765 [Thermoanaerobaculia bacterium]